jgi:hypothetical protein
VWETYRLWVLERTHNICKKCYIFKKILNIKIKRDLKVHEGSSKVSGIFRASVNFGKGLFSINFYIYLPHETY